LLEYQTIFVFSEASTGTSRHPKMPISELVKIPYVIVYCWY